MEACVCFISMFNLSGLPLTFGYKSKHFFITSLDYALPNTASKLLVASFCLIACLSSLVYSYRLLKNVFFDYKKGNFSLYVKNDIDISISNYYSNTTKFSTYSIMYLLICAMGTICYLVFMKVIHLGIVSDLSLLLNKTNKSYEGYFYSVYFSVLLFLIFFLSFANYRKNFAFMYIQFYYFTVIVYLLFFLLCACKIYFYFYVD